MPNNPPYRRTLIEVDLPLDDINRESAREKSIRHGHPSTLHLWWARRPLAACRAVIFASMVDDPSDCPDEFPTEAAQRKERERLHDIIRQLVKWENTNESDPAGRELLAEARCEIARSVARTRGETAPTDPAEVLRYLNDNVRPIYDPFAGGGSIPLEAQRLGLRAVASDLNPVAVLINKALIELPAKFKSLPPVNPDADHMAMTVGVGEKARRLPWRGAAGLADDIRYYGRWMREEAFKRIGHLYPQVKLPDETNATVIAWLWARTVPCPNPACGIAMPLMATFQLSKKKGNEHWIKPVIDRDKNSISFVVQNHNAGVPESGTVNRNGATCLGCGNTVKLIDALNRELPEALDQLTQKGHIAPTDLAQAAIGPGMQIYSRYRRVETISGEPVPVREALAAINRAIADYDERQEGDLDVESRFCLDWLKQHGYGEGQYGEAETLARAKNVAISKLQNLDGLLTAGGGRVKLLPLDEFGDSHPLTLGDKTAWEGCFRMAYHLNREEGRGVDGAGMVAREMNGNVESVERLARILYNHYDRKGDSQNALVFNNLVTAWQHILSALSRTKEDAQGQLFR